MSDTITYKFWLAFDSDGNTPRTTKNLPTMGPHSRAMHCSVSLPKSLFTRPQLKATIKVPEIDASVPEVNIEAAETALAEVIGATVSIEVLPPEDGQ